MFVTMKNAPRLSYRGPLLSLLVVLTPFARMSAQTAPAPAAGSEPETVKLSPFIVSSEGEKGYRSEQTWLAAARQRT